MCACVCVCVCVIVHSKMKRVWVEEAVWVERGEVTEGWWGVQARGRGKNEEQEFFERGGEV